MRKYAPPLNPDDEEAEAQRWVESLSDDEFKQMIVNHYLELAGRIRWAEDRLSIIERRKPPK
jgi:hypothetical protein